MEKDLRSRWGRSERRAKRVCKGWRERKPERKLSNTKDWKLGSRVINNSFRSEMSTVDGRLVNRLALARLE